MLKKLIVMSVLVFGTAPAFAQGTNVAFGTVNQDPSQPIEVSADNLSVNQTDGTAIYTGNVVIGQGEMRLAAPRVLVVYSEDAGQIDRLEATGGVTLVSGQEAAEAERADYNLADNVIIMAGNVLLTQGGNALSSDRMVVNLDDGTARMDGRVRSVIQPSSSSDESANQ